MDLQIKNGKKVKYLIILIGLILTSCTVQKEIKTQVVELKDSIQKPYVFINEIEIISKNKAISEKSNKSIQQLSENKTITTVVPKERLRVKKEHLEKCFKDVSCDYTFESYTILSNHKDLLNIKYKYNAYRSTDEWLKFAMFDLKTGKQFTHDKMFSNPKEVLDMYNEKHVSVYRTYMNNNKQETEEEKDEYEAYKEYLETRKAFTLTDLDNIEFVYKNRTQIANVRFHYKGRGGNYRQLFPNDYIEFSFVELKKQMSKLFVDRFVKI